MHILHGTWLSEYHQFALWGEDTGKAQRARRGRRPKIAPHPFELEHGVWYQYLHRFVPNAQLDAKRINMWLPSRHYQAQPSPEAQASGMVSPNGDLELLAWNLAAVLLSPRDAHHWLLSLPEQGDQNFVLGLDMQYWQHAALIASNALIEGRFVPGLTRQGRHISTHWAAHPDTDLIEQMTAAMPPLCRAIVTTLERVEPPAYLLGDFLSTLTDTFIRKTFEDEKKPKSLWLRALVGKNPTMLESDATNQALFQKWEDWHAARVRNDGVFRVGFRLSEPQDNSDHWRVDYLLQAKDDPSLLVEAATVWGARTTQLRYLEYRFHRPQEKLLAALGHASRMFPPIERSLRQAQPTGADLTREDAFHFLSEALPLLESSGFAVLVPNWWARRARFRAKATLKAQSNVSAGILTKDALLRYEWQISLGSETLSREEFETLVALKQPLVQHKGEWVALDPKHIEAAMAFFEQTKAGEMTLEDALKLNAVKLAPGGIELADTEIEGGLADVFEQLYHPEKIRRPNSPDNLHATLRPYQLQGFGWLAQMRKMKLGACLADDMGLGKTVQTIAIWLHERQQNLVDTPALLVCPTSVVGNWLHEMQRFAPSLKVLAHHGPARSQGDAFVEEAQ